MTNVLIMNGPAESGKGTVAKWLGALFALDIKEYSSIDYVKQVATIHFGWDGNKDVKGRNLLAAIKQVMIAYNDLPTKKVILNIKEAILFGLDVLVIDIREPDEIEKVVTYCKKENIICHTCRIHNKKAEENALAKGLSLTGDRLYGRYDYDLNIENNGRIEELGIQIVMVFSELYNLEIPRNVGEITKRMIKEVKKDGNKNDQVSPPQG